MWIFFKRLVVEEQNEKSNDSSIWENVHSSLIPRRPLYPCQQSYFYVKALQDLIVWVGSHPVSFKG